MRMRGLVRKEFLQVMRDPSSLAIAFLMPVVLLVLFGYGVSLDAEHVPVALVVEHPDTDTGGFTGVFRQSRYFSVVDFSEMRTAEDAMRNGLVDGIKELLHPADVLQRSGLPLDHLVHEAAASYAPAKPSGHAA